MPKRPHPTQRKRVKRTIAFEPEADERLTQLFPTGRGPGPFCSRLVLEDKLRKELAAKYAALRTLEQWDSDGCRVD